MVPIRHGDYRPASPSFMWLCLDFDGGSSIQGWPSAMRLWISQATSQSRSWPQAE